MPPRRRAQSWASAAEATAQLELACSLVARNAEASCDAGRMVMGGGSEFPTVDPRFDVQSRHLLGPFWQVQVVDTVTGANVNPRGGGFLTGFASVRRAATFSSRRYLIQQAHRR